MGYVYNEKYQAWAENVVPLYEEAVARQWSATRDIPWDMELMRDKMMPQVRRLGERAHPRTPS